MFIIAICDDESAFCEEMSHIIEAYAAETKISISTRTFYSGEQLINNMRSSSYYDLIFLDIEMSAMNGVDVGRILRMEMDNHTTQVVYVSCKENYYRDLFEIHPLNFISKPIKSDQIIKEVSKALRLAGCLRNYFEYKVGREIYKIAYKDIIWIESDNRKIRIITTQEINSFYGNLADAEPELLQSNFIRIHRGYLVNLLHIKIFRLSEIVMSNNVTLSISKTYQKKLRDLQYPLTVRGI